jgi:hypothetical protein
MTATTVTPEIVRVAFLRKTGRSLSFSFGFNACIISALEGTRLSWCLAATRVLTRFTSLCVGERRSIRAVMISRIALSTFKMGYHFKVSITDR